MEAPVPRWGTQRGWFSLDPLPATTTCHHGCARRHPPILIGQGFVSALRSGAVGALFLADARTPLNPAYGEGDAEAEALADEALADEALADEVLADALADAAMAEETPVGPALMVRMTGALGRASVPEAGSVPVTVPGSS